MLYGLTIFNWSRVDKLEQYLLSHQTDYPDSDSQLLRDIAYERLKDALSHADLEPGEPLSENRVSKALGISRTPVREAFQMLSSDGLVEVIPGRAVRVATRNFRDVVEGLHVRSLLEPEMVRLATEAISQEQLAVLWQSQAEMEAAVVVGDRRAWSIADTVWHETLCNSCPNQLLGELVMRMRNRVHRYTAIDHQITLDQLRVGTAGHREILQVIAARDSEAAGRLMREHVEDLRQNLFSQLIYS